MPRDQPILISAHRGFNLVMFGGRYCAVPQALGPLDVSDQTTRARPELLWAEKLDDLRFQIDAGSLWKRYANDQVVAESYRGFNLIASRGRYCAAPQVLGAFDLSLESSQTCPDLVWADDIDALKQHIDSRRLWKRYDPLGSDTSLEEFGLPEVVEIEPIHTCNLRCVMCHVSYEKLSKQRLSTRFLDSLDCVEGKWAKLGSLYEPVAHPQFAEIARGLTDRGVDIDLTTNGSLFTPALVDQVKHCSFRSVTISFDGIRPETYEKIRGRANYAQTLERIMAFKGAVKSCNPNALFQVNYTILRSNIDEIPEAVAFWEERGFDHIGFISMVLRDENAVLQAESVEPCMDRLFARLDDAARIVIERQYRIAMSSPWFRQSALKEIFPQNAGSPNDGVVMSSHPMARMPLTPSTHFQNGSFPGMPVDCRSPFKFARISYDGTVYLCYLFPIGNIYRQTLSDIWRSDEAERIREMVRGNVKICYACEYYKFCIKSNEIDYSISSSHVSNNKIDVVKSSFPYTILSWMGSHYAAPSWHKIAAADLADEQRRQALEIVTETDLGTLHERIRGVVPDFSSVPSGQFDLSSYHNYKISYRGNRIYGLPSWLSKVDLGVRVQRDWPGLLSAASLDELCSKIDHASSNLAPFRGYRLVPYEGQVWAVPQGIDTVDLSDPIACRRAKVLQAVSLDTISERIDMRDPLGIWRYLARRSRAALKALLVNVSLYSCS